MDKWTEAEEAAGAARGGGWHRQMNICIAGHLWTLPLSPAPLLSLYFTYLSLVLTISPATLIIKLSLSPTLRILNLLGQRSKSLTKPNRANEATAQKGNVSELRIKLRQLIVKQTKWKSSCQGTNGNILGKCENGMKVCGENYKVH